MNIKQIIITITLILSTLSAQALSIQGVLRNTDGSTVPNGDKTFLFQVYTVETGGPNAWYETKTLNVINGVYSHTLGSETDMSGLNFGNVYWLGISIDDAAELTPRTQLTLSPYAVIAQVGGGENIFPQNGTVAINNSTPSSVMALDVGGYIRNTVGGNYDVWIQGGSSLSGGTDRNLALLGDVVNDKLIINAGGEYSGGTILGGNVGIGTTSPDYKLHVKDTEYPLYLESNYGYGKFGAANSQYFHFFTDLPEFYFSKSINIPGITSPLIIQNGLGNTSIGPTNATAFHFYTDLPVFYFNKGILSAGDIEANGRLKPHTVQIWNGDNQYDVTWNNTNYTIMREGSSRRYKQNINEWDDHRNILNANVKTYQMKEGFGVPDQNHIGLIAEELHDLGLNHLVIYDKEKRPDAVKYKKVSLYLLEVVKDQNKEINEMESRLAALETAMEKLK